jgi:hypothetical protein
MSPSIPELEELETQALYNHQLLSLKRQQNELTITRILPYAIVFFIVSGVVLGMLAVLLGWRLPLNVLIFSIFLILLGIYLIFRSPGIVPKKEEEVSLSASGDAEYIVRQLSRNYEILRAQTNQGFLLSGIFMAIGLLIIVFSLFFLPSNGLENSVANLGILAGIFTEFISGTALFLYRLNFTRLNETSDRLDDSWKVLAAYNLTIGLPDDKKAEATMGLILVLSSPRNLKITPAVGAS